MRNIIIYICLIAMLIMSGVGYELKQSFVGQGQWSTSSKLGATGLEMSGDGDMSYAAQGTCTKDGTILKTGLEFDGTRGRVRMIAAIGPDLLYSAMAGTATHISLRTGLDTITSEETQDSNIGELLLYGIYLNGQINGSVSEKISDGKYMGRPIQISGLGGVGNFTINSSIDLKEYQAIKEE